MSFRDLAPIAITMGDAAGIGPEITAKLLADENLPVRPIVIGDVGVMERAIAATGHGLTVRAIDAPVDARPEEGVVEVVVASDPLQNPPVGKVDAACGKVAFDCICAGIGYANEGALSALVTAPINKASLAAAGIPYPGHTEMLADFSNANSVAMMLANNRLRVVLVTIHCALKDAIERITYESVLQTIRIANEGAQLFRIERPRVAVAGLNPHAGEDGLFGDEEQTIIGPAVLQATREGIDASGPWPGDTVFREAREGKYDVVVAQYHDQGLIPVKYLGLEDGVNITLGLPFIRTSPDHGTAFDIAGQGIADEASLRSALVQAVRLVSVRNRRMASGI